jgi:coenzyme PQQ biosynthesis protein PqqD
MTHDDTGLASESVPHLPRGVRLRFDETRDQWLLLGPERVFQLDAVGYEILRRLDGSSNLAAIVEDLARVFEADAATVETDVRTYLSELAARGMVELE